MKNKDKINAIKVSNKSKCKAGAWTSTKIKKV